MQEPAKGVHVIQNRLAEYGNFCPVQPNGIWVPQVGIFGIWGFGILGPWGLLRIWGLDVFGDFEIWGSWSFGP